MADGHPEPTSSNTHSTSAAYIPTKPEPQQTATNGHETTGTDTSAARSKCGHDHYEPRINDIGTENDGRK